VVIGVIDSAAELKLAHRAVFWPRLDLKVCRRRSLIKPRHEANLRIKVSSDIQMCEFYRNKIVVESCSPAPRPVLTVQTWRRGFGNKGLQLQVFKEAEVCIGAAGPIVVCTRLRTMVKSRRYSSAQRQSRFTRTTIKLLPGSSGRFAVPAGGCENFRLLVCMLMKPTLKPLPSGDLCAGENRHGFAAATRDPIDGKESFRSRASRLPEPVSASQSLSEKA